MVLVFPLNNKSIMKKINNSSSIQELNLLRKSKRNKLLRNNNNILMRKMILVVGIIENCFELIYHIKYLNYSYFIIIVLYIEKLYSN